MRLLMGFQTPMDFTTSVCVLWCLLHCFTFGTISTKPHNISPTDVSYRELEELGATCPYLDNCQENRTEESLKKFNCLCEKECAKLDACCIDSPFRSGAPVEFSPQCRSVYEKRNEGSRAVREKNYVFMVDNCKPAWDGGVAIQELCLSDPEETNDPFLAVPVTSKETKVTYKNYFCYVCNEDNSEIPIFWNVVLQRNISGAVIPNIAYSPRLRSWVLLDPTGSRLQKIPFSMDLPSVVKPLLHPCRPDVISACSPSWSDDIVKAKCLAYAAIIIVETNNYDTLVYKNAHCAICNFKNIENTFCSDAPRTRFPSLSNPRSSTSRSNVYTLTKKSVCGNNMAYDDFSKKCRTGKYSAGNSDSVTLADLQSLDTLCPNQNCTANRTGENLVNNNCLCSPDCDKLDACCVDSQYRTLQPSPETNLKCLKVYGNNDDYVFMKDTCREGWEGEALVRNLCRSSPETVNDPMLAIPTTSPATKTTYKNYFCFLCNEDEADGDVGPIFWNVVLKSGSGEISVESLSSLSYNNRLKSWMAAGSNAAEAPSLLNVSLSWDKPETFDLVHQCQPDVVSVCHDSWTDSVIRKKCSSYMSIALIDRKEGQILLETVKYRNLHCAFCNYEKIENLYCPSGPSKRTSGHDNKVGTNLFVRLINLQDDNRCSYGQVYDKRAKRCRSPRCVFKNYVLKNGVCSLSSRT